MKTLRLTLAGVALLSGTLLLLALQGEESGAPPPAEERSAIATPPPETSGARFVLPALASAAMNALEVDQPDGPRTGIEPALTREARLAAQAALHDEAEQAYLDRIDENVERLEIAIEAAHLEGRHAQVEVMEQRIDGLLRRLDAVAVEWGD